jgi:hypothetical protein
MNMKTIVAIMVCGVLFATVFVAYGQYQYNAGYNNGGVAQEKSIGSNANAAFQTGLKSGNATGYMQGYQAGLKASETKNG